MAIEQRIINAESDGRRHARNPNSSAYGPGQFISSTWLNMIARYRPDLMQGRSQAEVLALRSDPALNEEMTKRYGEENGRYLAGRGYAPSDENISLSHFAGPQGAAALLANPEKPARELLSPAAIKANPFLANWTGADVINWAGKRIAEPGTEVAKTPRAATPSDPFNTADVVASMAPTAASPTTPPAAAQPAPAQKEQAVLPFLASLFESGAGAAAGGAGVGSLGSALSGSGGLLSSLFGEGGFDFGKMMNSSGQPDPANPLAGAQVPQTPAMQRPQVDMSRLQALLANRPTLGQGPGLLSSPTMLR